MTSQGGLPLTPLEQAYAAAIPACCSLQTLQEHKDMLLCWGLSAAIDAGRTMDCTGCDLHKDARASK